MPIFSDILRRILPLQCPWTLARRRAQRTKALLSFRTVPFRLWDSALLFPTLAHFYFLIYDIISFFSSFPRSPSLQATVCAFFSFLPVPLQFPHLLALFSAASIHFPALVPIVDEKGVDSSPSDEDEPLTAQEKSVSSQKNFNLRQSTLGPSSLSFLVFFLSYFKI
jgi:hypothetical protein